MRERESINLITEAPDGWREQAVAKRDLIPPKLETISPQGTLVEYWEQTTGVKISESKFTVMIPVHDEERSLASSARALFLSLVPPEVEMHINFILNACHDGSEGIIQDLLSAKGKLIPRKIAEDEFASYQDQALQKTYFEVRQDKHILRVFKTKTRGKANALKLGSKIALQDNHGILISIDANNYVEPDTVAYMFREAYLRFFLQMDGTVVLSAIPKKIHKEPLGRLERSLREHGIFDDTAYIPVFGWCMALDTKWASENIQPVAAEDYALGVMARSQNRGVSVVNDAIIWGYRTNLKDNLRQLRRSTRGRLQLLDLHPELRPILESDNYFMRPLLQRIAVIAEHIKSDPSKTPKFLWRFIFGELALILGAYDYKHEPTNQSWEGLPSTK